MKPIIKAGLITLLSLTLMQAEATKLYEIKSGKIHYDIKGSGSIMGSSMKMIGKQTLLFDNYGTENLSEENKVEKQTIMGQTKIKKSHTMTLMKNGTVYSVDFERKKITRMDNMAAMMGADMSKKGKAMMQQMGGKKIGMGKVLNYNCEIWELMGTKQCLYQGIPLKVESDVMGMRQTQIATKAEFNKSLSQEDFKLPDFPLSDAMGNELDKSELDKMDKQSQKEVAQTQEALSQMMNAINDAERAAGIKPGGETATPQQQEAMQNAMMDAMLPQMKQEFMAQENVMRFLKKCLSDADTKKEAKACSVKANAMSGDDEESFGDEWNPQIKQQSLREIDHYLDVILPCMEKANNMQAMQSCMQTT